MTNIIHNHRFVKPYIIHKILDTSIQDCWGMYNKDNMLVCTNVCLFVWICFLFRSQTLRFGYCLSKNSSDVHHACKCLHYIVIVLSKSIVIGKGHVTDYLRQRNRLLTIHFLSGVPDYFDRNKILSGYDLSHYQVPHCIRVFFYFVWFVFIHHNFQFYFKLCTYCNILDIYLS